MHTGNLRAFLHPILCNCEGGNEAHASAPVSTTIEMGQNQMTKIMCVNVL